MYLWRFLSWDSWSKLVSYNPFSAGEFVVSHVTSAYVSIFASVVILATIINHHALSSTRKYIMFVRNRVRLSQFFSSNLIQDLPETASLLEVVKMVKPNALLGKVVYFQMDSKKVMFALKVCLPLVELLHLKFFVRWPKSIHVPSFLPYRILQTRPNALLKLRTNIPMWVLCSISQISPGVLFIEAIFFRTFDSTIWNLFRGLFYLPLDHHSTMLNWMVNCINQGKVTIRTYFLVWLLVPYSSRQSEFRIKLSCLLLECVSFYLFIVHFTLFLNNIC